MKALLRRATRRKRNSQDAARVHSRGAMWVSEKVGALAPFFLFRAINVAHQMGADIDRPEQTLHQVEVCAALQGTSGD